MHKTDSKHARKQEAILDLLSDAEVEKMEAGVQLVAGDEYVDLADMNAGVQRVDASPQTAQKRIVARRQVSALAWSGIAQQVAVARV